MRSVEPQNLFLGRARLKPRGQKHLHAFLPKRAGLATRHADDLHGEGAGARNDAPGLQILPRSAANGPQAHSRMAVEGAVLELDERHGELAGHRIAKRKTPLSVIGNAGAEQLAMAVGDHGGARNTATAAARAPTT